MRALFDVNILVAILDPDHIHHWRAHDWWKANQSSGWASCPLTENGAARIMSLPTYKNPITTASAVDLIAKQIARTDHEFWADDFSLCDPTVFDAARILGPLQITDVYLLALAVKHGGRLATLDRRISLGAVHRAEAKHLAAI